MKKLLLGLLLLCSNAFGQADYLSPNGMTEIMSGADDATAHISLGHTFPYYGGVFTDAWMSSNGFILLYDPVSQYGNSQTWNQGCCSGFNPTGNQGFSFMIAPLWTDLIDANATPDAGYYYETNSDESKFLWYNVNEYATQNTNTFQVNLWPDGSFDFIYDEVDITYHNTWIGFTGDALKSAEVNELKYAQGSIDEFGLDFVSTTFQGGRAWYGQDGGYAATGPDCSNALNDSSCPGYEEAYYSQQCNNDPFYDNQCPGYEQAYFEQQCDYDPLYDNQCSGYDNALLLQDLGGTDFVFGDDITDFYDTEPLLEEEMFVAYEDTSMDMFEEENYGYTETTGFGDTEDFGYDQTEESGGGPIYGGDGDEEVYTESIVFEDERDIPEEPIIEPGEGTEEEVQADLLEGEGEDIALEEEEYLEEYIEEEITHMEEDMSNIEEDLLISEEPVTVEGPKIDAVGIALTTAATAEQSAISTAMAANNLQSSEQGQQTQIQSVDVFDVTANLDLTPTDIVADIQMETVAQDIQVAEQAQSNINVSLSVQSVLNETNYTNNETQQEFTFGSVDNMIEDATFTMIVDPTITVDVIAAVESPTEQATQQEEEQTVEFQMESSTPQMDTGFAEQQNQSFSTGQSITAVLNNVAPNFSQFDVAPPSQQEQRQTARAEAAANNMSQEDIEASMERMSDDMQDSGGFSDQSLTMFLIGRVNGFDAYNTQLQDVSFYTDRGMPGGRVQNDRNTMLQMIGTSGKHEEMIAEQYK